MLDRGLRVETDVRPDRVSYKIRDASLQKTPYVVVVGEKERSAQTVNVRTRHGAELGAMSVGAFPGSLWLAQSKPARRGGFAQVAIESRAN